MLYRKVIQLYIYIFFYILHHYGLSRDSEYISLAIQKHLVVCPSYIFTPHLILLSHTPDLVNHKFVLYVCESVSALWICSFVSYFKFHAKVLSHGICVFLTSMMISGSIYVAAFLSSIICKYFLPSFSMLSSCFVSGFLC